MDTSTIQLVTIASDLHFTNILLLALLAMSTIDFIRRVIIPNRSNSRYD